MTEAVAAERTATHTTQQTAAQAAIRQLEDCGATTVFGIPGVHTLALYDALLDSTLTHVLARHEQGAGFMADGFARATGTPAVALVITGPGITNIATPIGEAYTDSSPVFVLSSNVERAHLDAMRGNLHDLKDQRAVMRSVTKWNDRAMDADDVPRLIAEGWNAMTTGRQLPVHLEVPLDVLDELVLDHAAPPMARQDESNATAKQVEQAAAMLADAKRPVIYAGGGATSSAAGEPIVRLAERLNAPVVTSTQGKGAIPDSHPNCLGSLWTQGNAVDDLVRKGDTLLVIGSRLGVQATEHFSFPIPANLIRIEIDPDEMERNATPNIGLQADARSASAQLADALELLDSASTWTADEFAMARTRARGTAFGVNRMPYLDAIRAAVPLDGVIAWDMTMMSYVATYSFPVERPRTFLFPTGYGTLGFSVPAAIGAKVGVGDRAVAAVVGDGGFQFTMQELATAVQFELGIPIIVFNDSTYSAVKAEQHQSRAGRFSAVDLVNPDYLKLAEAYDIPGVRASSPHELQAAITDALERTVPTIIDVPIEKWV
jgi:thiamine pyrophosphate-dependent acetolactate synthase large subunit-like protein